MAKSVPDLVSQVMAHPHLPLPFENYQAWTVLINVLRRLLSSVYVCMKHCGAVLLMVREL